jgi:periplasmic divalent cation tolerance protein
MKTTADRLPSLMATVKDAHTYEVPEIVATPIAAGDADYLAWIEDVTRHTG